MIDATVWGGRSPGRVVFTMFVLVVGALRYSALQNSRPPRDRSTISHRAHSHRGPTSYSTVHVNEPRARIYLRPAVECGSRTLNTGTWSVPAATLCRAIRWNGAPRVNHSCYGTARRKRFRSACGWTTRRVYDVRFYSGRKREREREGGRAFAQLI